MTPSGQAAGLEPRYTVPPGNWTRGAAPVGTEGLRTFYGHGFGTRAQRFDNFLTAVEEAEIRRAGPDTCARWSGTCLQRRILLFFLDLTDPRSSIFRYDRVLRPLRSHAVNQNTGWLLRHTDSSMAVASNGLTIRWLSFHQQTILLRAPSLSMANPPGPQFVEHLERRRSQLPLTVIYNFRDDLFIAGMVRYTIQQYFYIGALSSSETNFSAKSGSTNPRAGRRPASKWLSRRLVRSFWLGRAGTEARKASLHDSTILRGVQ